MNNSAHRCVRHAQAGGVHEDELAHECGRRIASSTAVQAPSEKPTTGTRLELQLGEQIDVVPGVVGDVANLFEPLRIGKARMSRQIDGEVLRQLLVKRHPLGFAAGGVQVEQRRPLATDGELGLLAGDGEEAGVWHIPIAGTKLGPGVWVESG